jgi:hypothetical protein
MIEGQKRLLEEMGEIAYYEASRENEGQVSA